MTKNEHSRIYQRAYRHREKEQLGMRNAAAVGLQSRALRTEFGPKAGNIKQSDEPLDVFRRME